MERYFTIQTDSSGDEYWYIQGQNGKWYRGWLMGFESPIGNSLFWFNFELVPGIGH